MAKRAGQAGHGELTVVGGASPKIRRPRKHEWTKKKERIFLTTLADSCNVTLSAATAGMSVQGAYARRKKIAAFRAGWAEAVAAGYQRLELALLDRALNGTERVVKRRDGSEERVREYSDQVALTLLRMHRDSAKEVIEEPAEQDIEEVRERLFEKLQRLRKRFDSDGQPRG